MSVDYMIKEIENENSKVLEKVSLKCACGNIGHVVLTKAWFKILCEDCLKKRRCVTANKIINKLK